MSNPVLVEVIRGSEVESRHRGAVAVFDAYGKSVMALGDVDRPIFPRSAVKAIQALPLLESGAADSYSFTTKELALSCASHSGEEGHVETALGMLKKAGKTGGDLECGAHWPFEQPVLIAMAASGKKPTAVYQDQAQAAIVAHPITRALACLIIAVAVVFGAIVGLGGKLFY